MTPRIGTEVPLGQAGGPLGHVLERVREPFRGDHGNRSTGTDRGEHEQCHGADGLPLQRAHAIGRHLQPQRTRRTHRQRLDQRRRHPLGAEVQPGSALLRGRVHHDEFAALGNDQTQRRRVESILDDTRGTLLDDDLGGHPIEPGLQIASREVLHPQPGGVDQRHTQQETGEDDDGEDRLQYSATHGGRTLVGVDPEADPADGGDLPVGARALVADLPAQPRHVHVECLRSA